MSKLIAVELIATRILEIRGRKIMLDKELAKIGVIFVVDFFRKSPKPMVILK